MTMLVVVVVAVPVPDVDGVAILTVDPLGTVGCHRCRIGMYRIMRAGRIIGVDTAGQLWCLLVRLAAGGRVRTVHRSPSACVRRW
jgi:hypothetical protein